MNTKTFENIYFTEGDDPLVALIGKKLKGRKLDGSTFSSKLIAVDGDQLYFETKKGRIILDHRSSIEHLEPVKEEVV